MGQHASRLGLTPEDLEQMQQATHFSDQEMRALVKAFAKLDKDRSGTITMREFMQLPDIEFNPLFTRVFSLLDADNNGEVDFKEFITTLSIFAGQGSKEEKLKFAFRVYDLNGDGVISNSELFVVLKQMVGGNLDDIQLQQLVDRTMRQADKNKDGVVSFEEFCQIISDTDIEEAVPNTMSIQIPHS